MRIIDTHTHLYGETFEEDFDEVFERARTAGVEKMLLPNVDMDSVPEIKRAVDRYPDYLYPMMGLHPTSIDQGYKNQLKEIKDILFSAPEGYYIGVGEVGLDYYWDTTYKAQQQDAFAAQIEWSRELCLPLSIHTRSSIDDGVDIYKEAGEGKVRGAFHSFTGNAAELKRIENETNAFVGINGVVTFKNSFLREFLARNIPLDRVIIETDAPYLTPVPFRGKRNEPAYLVHIIRELALIYKESEKKVSSQLFVNSCKLFNLDPE